MTIEKDKYYRHAVDRSGNRIHISAVNNANRHDGYRCLCCNGELTPVLGKKNAHHFRHKNNVCSYESYIHKLWKDYFVAQWSLLNHLYVSYNVIHSCNGVDTCQLNTGNRHIHCHNDYATVTIDLKEKYDSCIIEGCYDKYRADILLCHSKRPEIVPTFIEICYKHPCNEDKRNSGIPIVEIVVNDDNLHLPQPLSNSNRDGFPRRIIEQMKNPWVKLYGFNEKVHSYRRFYVYQDKYGIMHGNVDDSIIPCNSIGSHLNNSIMEIFVQETIVSEKLSESFFEFGIRCAAQHGIKIKHCRFCKNIDNSDEYCGTKLKIKNEIWSFNIQDLPDDLIDKTNLTYCCPNYKENSDIYSLEKYSYYLWRNNSIIQKKEKVPNHIFMKKFDRTLFDRIAKEHRTI